MKPHIAAIPITTSAAFFNSFSIYTSLLDELLRVAFELCKAVLVAGTVEAFAVLADVAWDGPEESDLRVVFRPGNLDAPFAALGGVVTSLHYAAPLHDPHAM